MTKITYMNTIGEFVNEDGEVINKVQEESDLENLHIKLKIYDEITSQIVDKDIFNNNDIIKFIKKNRLNKYDMIDYVLKTLWRVMAIVNKSGKKYNVITDLNDYENEDIENYTYPFFYYNKHRIETLGEEKLKDMIMGHCGIHIYHRSIFNPTNDVIGHNVYNTFIISKYHYVDYNKNIDTSLFFNYVKEILCDDCNETYEDLLNWISFVIQQRKSCGVMPILQGKNGDGKSMLYKVMELLIGKRYCKTFSSLSDVLGHFNNHIKEILLISIEELGVVNHQDEGLLKDFITNSSNKAITEKGKDTKFYDLYYNIMATTNCEKTVNCDTDTRRQMFLKVNQRYIQQAGSKKLSNDEEVANKISLEFWKKFTDTLLNDKNNDGILGQIYYFFKTRDISNVNIRKISNTKYRQIQVKKQEDKQDCNFYNQLKAGHFVSLIEQNTTDYKEKDTKNKKRGVCLDILYEEYHSYQEKSGFQKSYIQTKSTFKNELEENLNITPSLGKPIKSLKKDVMTYYDLSFILLEHKDDEEKEEKENSDSDGDINDLQF